MGGKGVDLYLRHPNRVYYGIFKSPYGPTYKTRRGKTKWKHRDARWILENHELGAEWRIVPCRVPTYVREYRQSKSLLNKDRKKKIEVLRAIVQRKLRERIEEHTTAIIAQIKNSEESE